ncbi:MAG: ELWxxDGT repeat protein [Saprospiraceae bacterium]|jgi:ELWxxDGT repeat protein
MRRIFLHLAAFFLCFQFGLQSLCGQEILIKDINPGVGWSSIEFKFRIADNFYFVANSDFGNELWISDGSANGTMVLKDINPTPFTGSSPDHFIEYNGTWYFTADDGTNGNELWKTDGTIDGTVMVLDINPGAPGSEASGFALLNGFLYFSANDGTNGVELWKSNGLAAGTEMVADIFLGIASSLPEFMVAQGTDIVFAANDGINGKEVWKSDGTGAGTILIKDVFPGASSSFPEGLTTVGDKVYFIADDGLNGKEVWRTDGTTSGTALTADIYPGAGHPEVRDLNAAGDYLFFVADNGTDGEELFRSDANAVTPLSELVEIFPDTFGSTPTDFMVLNGDLIFNANNGLNGFEIWKASASDGAVAIIKDIFPGFDSSSPAMLAVLNNDLVFKARGEGIGFELWKTDGTEAGTVLLGDLNTDPSPDPSNSDPTRPMIKDNVLYFSATDYINGYQIWRTDGTSSATQRLTSISHDTLFNNNHKPYFINNVGNSGINFIGLTDTYGEELWDFDIDPITISAIQTNSPLNCNGDTNGTIDITVTGGVGDPACFTYSWSEPGLSGLSLTDLPAGSYTLSVADCVGFETITNIILTQPVAVSGMAQQTSAVSCAGGSDGQATISGTGGTLPYNYLWDNDETGPTATLLDAGTHSITITDDNGCIGVETVMIIEPGSLTVTTTPGSPVCFGGSNGQASATPGGGTPDYTFIWDNGETSATPAMLDEGNHSVTVTDSNGCTATATVVITAFTLVSIDFNNQNVSCINGNNGSSMAIASGGTGTGYTYSWGNGSTGATAFSLSGGDICVTVTDNNGCTADACTTILTPIISAAVTGAISCIGAADGAAAVNIINANSTYTYLWDNGETGATATLLNAGTHSVTITDVLTCSTVVSVMISEPLAFVVSDSLSVSPTCFGANDGTVTYNFSGGTAPYSYTWSTGEMTDTGTLSNLDGGIYCATVTDANNCATYTFCSILEEPELITMNLTAIADPTCFGVCNGTATASVSSGNPGQVYIYNWSSGIESGGETSMVTNLCVGMNTVSVFDGTCTVIDTFVLEEPTVITPLIDVIDATCYSDVDGSVTVNAIGGMSPYTYEYSGGVSGLAAGNYTVTITDDFSCSVTESFTVGQPDSITLEYMIQRPSCIGDGDGSVTPIPLGGTAPYSFEYSDGSADLSAGTYSITVTDANNCVQTDSFTIAEPTLIEISIAVTDISCFGEGNGSVITTAVGGSGGYTFEYNNGSDDLQAGTYMVSATDSNGCMMVDSFSIIEPELLTTAVTATDISCAGAMDGMVVVAAAGGTMPYSFDATGGLENLAGGTYFVTTTDANGCLLTDTFTIIEPLPLDISFAILSPISCFGASDGSVTVTLTGGTEPYTYDSLYTDLSAGPFNIAYDDANGCGGVIIFALNQPPQIILVADSTDATGDEADGTAIVMASGGVEPYTYDWNTEPVQNTPTATELLAGDYEVTVTDADGCTSVLTVTVNMFVNTNELDESLRFDLYPNPANEQVILDLTFLQLHQVDLKIYDSLGRLVYKKDLGAVQKEQIDLDVSAFGQGIYWVQLYTEEAQYVRKLSVVRQ